MMKARSCRKRAILASLKWGEGWFRFLIYFVQDCRFKTFAAHPCPKFAGVPPPDSRPLPYVREMCKLVPGFVDNSYPRLLN